MKTKTALIAGFAALSMVATPMAAAAQSWRDHDRHDRYERRYDRDSRYDRHDRHDRYDRYDRRDRRYDRRDDRRWEREQRREYRRWARGQSIPREYRSRWYVSDYSRYGYRQPPRGYGYYRTDTGDVVLAAIATGVIISLLSN